MNEKLLSIEAHKLLKKFGSGSHKPGSGSAAAFQGMLSAQLVHTVIALTTVEKRRNNYGEWFPKLLSIDTEILNRIIPRLEMLFEEDSVQFGKVITLRNNRDNENDPERKGDYEIDHLNALKVATEIPIEIAKLSNEVAQFAAFVFENGFQAARGDSSVALNGAISAIAGCISVIDLNLLSFHIDKWTEKIREETNKLRSNYENLHQSAVDISNTLKEEERLKNICHKEINELVRGIKIKTRFSNADIEEKALLLQRIIWKHKDILWRKSNPKDPINILKPDIIFRKAMGYQFYRAKELLKNESRGESHKIAGIINQKKRYVFVSEAFSEETQNFTAAHELGHALFHNQTVLHRDKPLDGSTSPNRRNVKEYQADKFATFFLMPKKQIKEVFEEWFLTSIFTINENTAFNLIQDKPSALRAQCKSLRGLSRMLASAESYGPLRQESMSKLFNVSIEAMAIRLEELELVEF